MNNNSNSQSFETPPATYPPQPVSTPPPMGYPCNDGVEGHCPKGAYKLETKRKGDGFWKGCFAALCCCCVLDACF